MAVATSRISAIGCAALLLFSSAVGRAATVVVPKYENLLHERNVAQGTNFSPFFTTHIDGTPFLPANGWAPIAPVQAAVPGTTSTTPKKSFSFVGDSTAAGNWTDGNGIPAGITLTFDAQFTVSAITTTEASLMLTVPGASTENASGRGFGLTVVPGGADDINNGRGLEFSPVIVSNVSFSGTLADSGYTFTPGGVSGFGTQLFESGQFNETSQGMTLTQGDTTIGFGQATGSTPETSNLRMNLNFGPLQNPPVAPPQDSSLFPRQSGPYTMITTQGSGTTFRGMSLGYDVTYDISVASAVENPDFNSDGAVDGADFLIWQRGYGAPGNLQQGDANGDNAVNDDDLAIWKGKFGTPAVAALAGVPEPSTGLLALTAAIGAAAVRCRRRAG